MVLFSRWGGVATADWVIENHIGEMTILDDLNPGPIDFIGDGEYDVMVTAYDSIGCADDTSVTILVGGAKADFSSEQTSICPNESVAFTSLSLGGNLSYNWSFPRWYSIQFYRTESPLLLIQGQVYMM